MTTLWDRRGEIPKKFPTDFFVEAFKVAFQGSFCVWRVSIDAGGWRVKLERRKGGVFTCGCLILVLRLFCRFTLLVSELISPM